MDALIFNLRAWQRTQAPTPTHQPFDHPYDFSSLNDRDFTFDCSQLFNFEEYFLDQDQFGIGGDLDVGGPFMM